MRTKKIKILYVMSTLRRSGPTVQLLGRVTNLDKEKFELRILTISPEPVNSLIQDFLNRDIKVDSLNLSRIKFQVKGYSSLKKYIEEYIPDIIHTSGVRADSSIARMNMKKQHCMTIENYAYDDYVAKYGKLLGKVLANNSIKSIKNCNYAICCSKSLKNIYEKTMSKKLYVVQNGVDTNRFKPALNMEEKIHLRSSLEIPKDRMVFLVVGSLIKRKDPITIIKAFKNANLENKAVLIFLGSGDLMEQCKSEANQNIILKGNVRNVGDYLKASDVYISASKSEGLPNSVLEAGSCGLKLILSEIPQHREIFESNPQFANFFKVGDIESLSMKISGTIEESNKNIEYSIVKYIDNNFSSKVMSKNYEEIYYLMLAK